MNDELKYLLARTVGGQMNRRNFLGRAAALGVTATAANTMLATGLHAQTPKKGGTLKMGMQGGGSTDSLDPALSSDEVTIQLLRLFGDPLVEADPQGGPPIPRLATSWDSSPDAKTWTFKIRKGVKFHNGKTMTPDDVSRRSSGIRTRSRSPARWASCKGIKDMKVDGDNFVMTLDAPNADLPYLMTDYHLMIQPNGGMDDPAAGIGTGAYKIVRQRTRACATSFEKHPDYWDESMGHFDSVEILVINDATARNAALQSGQVHMVNRVDPKVADLLDRAPNVDGRARLGPRALRVHHALRHRAVRQQRPAHGAEAAPSTARRWSRRSCRLRLGRQRHPDQRGLSAVRRQHPAAQYDPEKAAHHYKKSGHDGSPILLRTVRRRLLGRARRRGAVPAVGARPPASRCRSSASRTTATGRTSGTSSRSAPPTGAAARCRTRCIPPPISRRRTGTTPGSRTTKFDKLLLAGARRTGPGQAQGDVSPRWREMVRDEGGLIAPMFNDFVEATASRVAGWVKDPNHELMNGYAPHKCWCS